MISFLIIPAGSISLVTYAMCRAASQAEQQEVIAFRHYQERKMKLGQDEPAAGSPPAIHG